MKDDDIVAGYRFRDLLAANIITSRADLSRKQQQHGFPLPVKFGGVAAFFPKAEVNAWVRDWMDQRDDEAAARPVKKLKFAPPSASRKPAKRTKPPARRPVGDALAKHRHWGRYDDHARVPAGNRSSTAAGTSRTPEASRPVGSSRGSAAAQGNSSRR